MYFCHTGSVLSQGEYGNYYHETVFPNIMKKLASDYPDENIGELDRETKVTSHTEGAQSSPSTPKRLQEVLTGKLNKLKDTPISPQGIRRNHLVETNIRIDNLEQSIIDVRETQNQQLDPFNKIVQRLDQLTGLNDRKQQEDAKFLIDELAQKALEADSAKVKINKLDIILSNKEDVIEELNNQCLQQKLIWRKNKPNIQPKLMISG